MRLFLLIFSFLLITTTTYAQENMMAIQSPYSVDETLDRFEAAAKKKGLTIFTRIEHSKNAAKAGISLRPTSVLIFGNPKVGTQIMQKNQTAAIDLPLKVVAWKGEDKQVWLSYNRPYTIMQKHHITDLQKLTVKMGKLLKHLSAAAVSEAQNK